MIFVVIILIRRLLGCMFGMGILVNCSILVFLKLLKMIVFIVRIFILKECVG